MNKHIWILIFLTLLVLTGCSTNNSALENPVRHADSSYTPPEYEKPGTFEKMIADVVMAIPNWIIHFLGLRDINEIVFGLNQDGGLTYGLFPSALSNAMVSLYDMQADIIIYLVFLALGAWMFIGVFQAGNPMSRGTFREMTNGFVLFLGCMYFGSYLFQMIFGLNTFLIKMGFAVMNEHFQKIGIADPASVSFFTVLSYALGGIESLAGVTAAATTAGGLGGAYFAITTGAAVLPYAAAGIGIAFALVIFIAVCFVAMFNFQFIMRTATIGFHIAMFPAVAYSSIFPASRMAFNTWLQSFLSLVLAQGMQALFLGYAYTWVLSDSQFMSKLITLFVVTLMLLTIPGFVTLILGAPGGFMSSTMGVNGIYGIRSISRQVRGGKNGQNVQQVMTTSSTGSNQMTTPRVAGQATAASGYLPNMTPVRSPGLYKGVNVQRIGQGALQIAKSAPKAVGIGVGAFVAGAAVATVAAGVTAVTGNMGAGTSIGSMALGGATRMGGNGRKYPENQGNNASGMSNNTLPSKDVSQGSSIDRDSNVRSAVPSAPSAVTGVSVNTLTPTAGNSPSANSGRSDHMPNVESGQQKGLPQVSPTIGQAMQSKAPQQHQEVQRTHGVQQQSQDVRNNTIPHSNYQNVNTKSPMLPSTAHTNQRLVSKQITGNDVEPNKTIHQRQVPYPNPALAATNSETKSDGDRSHQTSKTANLPMMNTKALNFPKDNG